jgi:hypothetical protein
MLIGQIAPFCAAVFDGIVSAGAGMAASFAQAGHGLRAMWILYNQKPSYYDGIRIEREVRYRCVERRKSSLTRAMPMQTEVSNTETSEQPSQPAQEKQSAAGTIDVKHDEHRRWTLIGKDDSEFMRTAGELLEGSMLLAKRSLMIANLTGVFRKVINWCDTRSPSLQSAYVGVRPGKISLFFVAESSKYDLQLDDAMTDLEVELGGSGGVGSVESFQIPERSTDQFIGRDAVKIWQRKS